MICQNSLILWFYEEHNIANRKFFRCTRTIQLFDEKQPIYSAPLKKFVSPEIRSNDRQKGAPYFGNLECRPQGNGGDIRANLLNGVVRNR